MWVHVCVHELELMNIPVSVFKVLEILGKCRVFWKVFQGSRHLWTLLLKKKKKKCGHFRKIAIPWKSVELLGSVDGTGKNGKMIKKWTVLGKLFKYFQKVEIWGNFGRFGNLVTFLRTVDISEMSGYFLGKNRYLWGKCGHFRKDLEHSQFS